MKQLNVGDQIPTFSVRDALGNEVSTEDLHGYPAVIHFGPDASAEAEMLAAIFPPIYDSAEGLVIGVSAEEHPVLEKLIDDQQLVHVLLSDHKLDMSRAFGTVIDGVIEPSTFIIDGDGTVVWLQRGVSLAGHGEDVLQAFDELFFGAPKG